MKARKGGLGLCFKGATLVGLRMLSLSFQIGLLLEKTATSANEIQVLDITQLLLSFYKFELNFSVLGWKNLFRMESL